MSVIENGDAVRKDVNQLWPTAVLKHFDRKGKTFVSPNDPYDAFSSFDGMILLQGLWPPFNHLLSVRGQVARMANNRVQVVTLNVQSVVSSLVALETHLLPMRAADDKSC